MTPLILFTYQYKDHTSTKLSTGLGNNRLSYADANGNGKIDTPGSTAVTVWKDDFEDKAKGDWESVGAKYGRKITGFDTTKARSGTTSGYITINSSGPWTDYYVHSNEWIDINNSTPTLYKFSGWVYVDPSIYRAQFYFFMNKAGETDYYTEFDYVETREKNKWVFIEKTVLVQPEIKKLNFRIDADGNYTGTVWYDDLKIEKLDMSQNEIVSETNYYPFGLEHKGYNEHVNSTNLGEQFKFNGKELNDEMDLGWYDYGWRNYDPSLGRWFGIDNLAEKYISSSPYHYAGNNPILNFDIDGNEFTDDAWEWVNKLISNINNRQERNNERIAEKRARLEEGGLSNRQKRRLNRQIGNLKGNNTKLETVRGEIATLEASDQVYDVVVDNGGTERDALGNSTTTNSTSMNFANGNVEITVSSGTGLGLFAHELKHAHQFEIGEASFGERGGTGFTFLLDKNDELAGYQRQALFGSNGGVHGINNLPDNYSSLPTGPINIHNLSPAVSNLVRTGNSIQLQALANQRNQAFRANSRTFIPNRN